MAMEIWLLVVVSNLTALVFVLFICLILIYLTSGPNPNLDRFDSEKHFYDPALNAYRPFPFALKEDPQVELSVIVPAYNESKRLPLMMKEAMEYLENRKKANDTFTYEVIIVDDGSRDDTTKTALQFTRCYTADRVRVLTFKKNKGKGGAVRMGMLSARGRYLLFADADGATLFSDIAKLEAEMKKIAKRPDSMAIVCGSRAHLEEESKAKRSMFRTLLMHGFHALVWSLCVRHVRDTQCGFKLLTREAARLLFHNLHVERWAFDVDLLFLAEHFKVATVEVPVTWEEIEGSKIVPVFSWLQMGKDLILIRLRYTLGAWKIEPKHKLE